MSFEQSGREPSSAPNANGRSDRQPSSEFWGPWQTDEEDTLTLGAVPSSAPSSSLSSPQLPSGSTLSQAQHNQQEPRHQFVNPQFPQFIHREHVSGHLSADPAEATLPQPSQPPYSQFQGYSSHGQTLPSYAPYPQSQQSQLPGGTGYKSYATDARYQAYPGYQEYQGYVPGYPYSPYTWQLPQPVRDPYQLTIAIISIAGSSLVLLAGLICTLIIWLFTTNPPPGLSASDYFSGLVLFIAFACSGVLGGIFGLYHSIRALLRKPSASFKLPAFWIFVILYVVVVAAGYVLQSQGQAVSFPTLTILLIALAGTFPALAVLALGVRRLRFPSWPTSWRRFTLAVVSGATIGITLAGLLELGLGQLLARGMGGVNPLQCIDRPDLQGCRDPNLYNFILIIVAVIAPLVEEAVKPLAVVALIGRIRSAAEAFVLGLACGVGFDLIETTGYISSGYHDWLSVALIRSGASLLHGFGAAMVALGWYYLTHAKRYRLLLALACWSYAVLQHAIWNGSWGLVLLPDPLGHFFDTWKLNLGFITLASYEVINIVEALFMLTFFIYMTGKLRTTTTPSSRSLIGESRR